MRNFWNSKLSSVVFLIGAALAPAQAQFRLDNPMPARKGTYLFPIKPGNTAIITGTMGELRNTHFHAGLDIDTPGIGVPVLAAESGYIARATATTGGYGNVLYVTHPDGNTTVYAHLEEFKGAVGDFIRKERYKRKVSEIDLEFTPNQFPVTKGDLLALSGNTGGSGGPHLHFEVRDQNNDAINPLSYEFAEVKDNLAPLVFKIALKTLDANARINDQFGRFEFSVVKNGNSYSLLHPILANGSIGVEVLAHDKMENSRFRYGINYINLLVDSQQVFQQVIDKVNFGNTRQILTLMDYKSLELNGNRFNKLYVDDGNRLDYYGGAITKQGITVTNDKAVEIRLRDYNQNESKVRFNLKYSPAVSETPLLAASGKPYETELIENTLKVQVKQCTDSKPELAVWSSGKSTVVAPAYSGSNQLVYLVNLRTILPDSMTSCQGTIRFNFKDRIPSETEYKYYSELLDITFPPQSLYDTLYLNVAYDTLNQQEIFTIGDRTIPLHKNIAVTLKPKMNYFQSRSLGLYRKEGRGFVYVNSEWKNNRLRFNTRDFGQFTLMRDTIPPTITKISLSSATARFKIRDNLSGISYFEANINGEWLLMVYDYKTGILKSEKPEPDKMLKGDFELKVVDQAGNEALFKQKL
ncbi:MAG: M23 family metallopeptidase [Cyclobacteriaceae bacterium]|nr:M23 family metallopeptidase [Cyclobacteriaceae bacterium]